MPMFSMSNSKTDSKSDSLLIKERYDRLLLALKNAINQIRSIEKIYPEIDIILERFLPSLAEALNAEQAFAAILQEEPGVKQWIEITAAYPRKELCGERLEWSELLQQLIQEGKPKTSNRLGEKTFVSISGLEIFNATSAILVPMQTIDQTRIVGVCNKINSEIDPFFEYDGMALKYIIELVAIGVRIGEQYKHDLEIIKETSATSTELDLLDDLLPLITKMAITYFYASAVDLMLWDEKEENLVIKASNGLTNNYIKRRFISKKKIYEMIEEQKIKPIINNTPDLSEQRKLLEKEDICTFMSLPLIVKSNPIGLLNIYNKNIYRQFNPNEYNIAQIFVNNVAISIIKIKQAEQLFDANTVAILGLWGVEFTHEIANTIDDIRFKVRQVKDLKPSEDIIKLLQDIDVAADSLRLAPLPEWPPSPEKISRIHYVTLLDDIIIKEIELHKIAHPSIHFELKLDCSEIQVIIHPFWLRHIIRHLVRNAINSLIYTEEKKIIIHTDFKNGLAEIKVEDNGCGIPSQLIPNLFKKFINHPGRRPGRGLFLTRLIAELHGGQVNLVDTKLNKGTCFVIKLRILEGEYLYG
jgi:hypothetical protein